MDLNSIWVSLIPLIIFNIVLLSTVLIFRPVYRKRERLKEVEERPASKFLNRWMREYWLWLTEPFVRLFVKLKFSPNLVTSLGVLIGFVSGYFFWKGHFGLGGWLMIFGASFDTFDGRVARATHNETKSGAYFDSIMDRISEGAVFVGLALYYRHHWALAIVLACLLGSYMVSYTKSKGDEMGARYEGGSMQRPERIVYLGVGAVFSPVFAGLVQLLWLKEMNFELLSNTLYIVLLSFVALMTWGTSIDRAKNIMQILDKKKF